MTNTTFTSWKENESAFSYAKRFYEHFGYLPEDELGDVANEVRDTDWWKNLHPQAA